MTKKSRPEHSEEVTPDKTLQGKVSILAEEVLNVIKELHKEQRQLVNSKLLAKKILSREAVHNILATDAVRDDLQGGMDSLKETVDNILGRFTDLVPDSIIWHLTDIKAQDYNKISPEEPTERLNAALKIVKEYFSVVSSRVKSIEGLLQKATICLAETEKHLKSELALSQGDLKNDGAVDQSINSDMGEMKECFNVSSDINIIKEVVFSRIDSITQIMEEKKDQDIRKLKETEETLQKMTEKMNDIIIESTDLSNRSLKAEIESLHDSLTGLYNRKAYDNKIEEALDNFERYGTWSSMLICDIDHFKKINDNYGHHIGDLILKRIAQLFKETIRSSDFVSRYGGEEFVCIMSNTQLEDAKRVAEKVISFIDKTSFTFKDKEVPVTISVGLSTLRKEDTVLTVFERADAALYVAKSAGRNSLRTEDELSTAENMK